AQIEYFAGRLEKEDEENFARLAKPVDQIRENRIVRLVDNIEDWVGKLEPSQTELVERYIDTTPDTRMSWYEFRKSRGEGLIALLRNGADQEEFEDYLTTTWVNYRTAAEKSRLVWQRSQNAFRQLVTDLDATLSDKQRAKLLRKLTGYRRNIAALLPRPDTDGLAAR
ncbi:MAG: DUF6279 family lipoprotein, partial [Gammaproteobacteria bacterium]|nr:DUF6279 family lipoprotein [Gammaproteobacteria bacterium]